MGRGKYILLPFLYGGEYMARQRTLNKRQKAFCEKYVFENMSAAAAYQTVYECEYTTAKAEACRMMKKPLVREYIEALQKEAWESACITAERVGMKLAEIAFAAKGDEYYTANTQLKALDLLQKQMGLQHQKIEADVSTDINITIEE